jgi:hypothetical protein
MMVPDDGDLHDEFGNAVAADGKVVAVGSHQSDGVGAAYVFRMEDATWRQTAKRTAGDGDTGDYFGTEMDLSGGTLVVAAEREASNGYSAGAVYVYERDLGGVDGWQETVKLTPSNAGAYQYFGEAVAVDGGIAVIGSVPSWAEGGAFVFYRNRGGPDAWGEVKKITAADGAIDARFGDWLALDGDTLVVCAYDDAEEAQGAGAAYIFERNAGGLDNWGQVAKLTAGPDAGVDFYFGWSAAVHGDVVVVGAVGDDDRGYLTGAAYVFSRNQGGANAWGRVARLVASNPYQNSWYGQSVAVYGDTIAVGADLGLTRGRVYIYRRNQGGADAWGQVANFGSSLTTTASRFGRVVKLQRDSLLVGDPYSRVGGVQTGSAHVRSRNEGGLENWGEIALLFADDRADGDRFADGVALAGNNIAIGAYTDDDVGIDSGSVYLYRLAGDEADLGVEINSDESAILPGSTFILTAIVSNAGPQIAEAASVDVSFDPATVDSSAVTWTCGPGPGATEGTVCPASGVGSALETGVEVSLNSGESVVFELTVQVLGSASGEIQANTTARPPDFTLDPYGSNNADTVVVDVIEFDFGDAPDPTYPTLLASDGPRHVIVDGLHLGSTIDPEMDGQPNAIADGDDSDGLDDEDGVAFTSRLVPGQTAGIEITASAAGLLDAWIDFNRDGDWNDAGEQVFTNQALSGGANVLEIQVPAGVDLGATLARFRFSSQGSLGVTGLAADGEVEDHPVAIVEAPPSGIFADGFESGDTSRWTEAVGAATGEIFSDGFESAGVSRWTHAVW